MSGFTKIQKEELTQIVGGAVDELARTVQVGFSEMHKEFGKVYNEFGKVYNEFGKVYERLNTLEDRISYSSQSFSLLMRDLEETKARVTKLEEKTGIKL